ncbi:protein GVQW3 isoform X2 [Pteropus medius]|uniref:protein GVQW3 isoform X2 n=1 Tax=Pteropus vampyrus TaxID=132908 RepID=UPI00196B816D|nr:protein GVQW3 isoform X2 [Pteropus giganteus]
MRARARKGACPGVARWRRGLAWAVAVRLRRPNSRGEEIAHAGVSPGTLEPAGTGPFRPLDSDWKDTIGSPGSPACQLQISGLISLCNCT